MQPDLFGAGAKLLLAIPSEIENELELLNGLRVKTGPHADAARLLQHIRSARGKLHWAVNSYFRDVFTNQWNDAVLDFEPPRTLFGPPQTGSHQPDSAELPSMPDSAVSGTLDNFPCSVLEEIFIHLDAWSLCQTSKVNKIFKKASSSNNIWKYLFHDSWGGVVFPTDTNLTAGFQQQMTQLAVGSESNGPPPQPSVLELAPAGRSSATPSTGDAPKSSPHPESFSSSPGSRGDDHQSQPDWRAQYRAQAVFAHAMRCPRCGEGGIVPVVYGFPSPLLLVARKSRRMILGGDHLIEDCHVWACTACNSSFRSFPYSKPRLWLDDLAQQKDKKTGSMSSSAIWSFIGTAYAYEC